MRNIFLTKNVSSFTLKIIAIICMTANHVSLVFESYIPFAAHCVLLGLGGVTFPVMAFLILEGYIHTSNVKKYALRLFIFGLISEIPYWYVLGHQLNIMFTLFIGLLILIIYDTYSNLIGRTLIIGGLIGLSSVCDWGLIGPLLILLFYQNKDSRYNIILPMLAVILPYTAIAMIHLNMANSLEPISELIYSIIGGGIAILFLSKYNGQRGPALKYFFYVYYPLHIAVIGLIFYFLTYSFPIQ